MTPAEANAAIEELREAAARLLVAADLDGLAEELERRAGGLAAHAAALARERADRLRDGAETAIRRAQKEGAR